MLYSALLLFGVCAGGLAKTFPESLLGKPDALLSAKPFTEGSLIIQLKSNAKLGKRHAGRSVHTQFHKRASLAGLDYTVRTEFKNEALFYGLSINLDRNKTLEEVNDILKDMPEVEGIWPNLFVPKPGPAPGIGNLTDTEDGGSKKAKARIGPVDDDSKLPQIKGANVKSTHKMTGIDKVHEKGIKGKGVKIGIIDTGIDYRHPALGGGFGPGFKVAGGYSFLDDEWDRYADRDPIEGPDPITTCNDNAHGTHVAGIIGMQDAAGQGFGLVGAAPDATIYMYKVFGCAESRGTTVELIMRAMVKAVEDGVDVISMSLGGNNYFEASSPYASLTEAIRDMGIGLVISNGNDGALGLYAQSSPADGKGVIAVGSITNDYFPVTYRAKDSNGKCFQYGSVWPLVAPELEIYYHGIECSYNSWLATAEAVNKIGADKVIVIAEIHDPKCPLGAQMSAASAFGIPNLLAFTSESLDSSPYARDIETQVPFPSVATVLVPPGTGRKLVENFKKDPSYKLKFPNTTTASGLKLETGGLMSNFSSFGPSWDTVAVKPTLSAPGGKILSTWVLGPSAGYAIISGTSMAAPLVAGCWALLKSQNPALSASEISKILQSTSTPLAYFPDQTIRSSVAHQGSGMINVYQAIMSETLVTPSELSLGDTDDYEGADQTIKITNRGSSSRTYTISHEGAGYAEAFPYPDLLEPNYWRAFGQPQYDIYGSSTFDQQTVVIPAGSTVEVKARISPPKLTSGQINKTPLMSGFIQLTSPFETYTIPYLGVPYSRQNESALDTTKYQYADGDKTYSPEQPFVFCGSCGTGGRAPNTGFDEYNGTDWNFPSAYFNIITGIQHFQVNIVPANVKFTPTHHGGNPPEDSEYEYMKPDITPRDKWMGLPSYGWIADSSQKSNYAPREVTANYPPYQADALFRWGAVYHHDPQPGEDTFTYLPNGDYRFLLSLLKPGSDYDDLSQWETYLGPVMRLVGDNY